MRILHLYKDYYPVVGGIENHVRWLAEAQAAAGHDVTVLVCSPDARDRREEHGGVRVVKAGRLATVASMPLSASYPVLLRRMRPDVAHVHGPFPLGAVFNWMLGRARATVFTHHSDIVRQAALLRLYGPLLRRVLGAADAIVATSPPYVRTSPWLREHVDKCTVVPLGIPPRISPSLTGEADGGNGGNVLFVGCLRYYKGLDTLLHAASMLPDVTLNVVGDGPMREPWEQLGRRLDLGDRVRFWGNVPDDVLAARYAEADLFVLPANARAEAFGTVLLEAMQAALPMVTTELGTGTSWVNLDGRTGRVVPPRDPEAMAAAIAELTTNATLRRRFGEAGRTRAADEFTVEVMARRVEDVYRRALHRA